MQKRKFQKVTLSKVYSNDEWYFLKKWQLKKIENKSYTELTQDDWELLRENSIVNWFWPSSNPIFSFILSKISWQLKIANAEIHDFNYWKWWTEADRKVADVWFFEAILYDCSEIPFPKKLYYFWLSIIFFLAVRFFWKYYFNYSKYANYSNNNTY